jgi:tetratricopeptide (TPR) repeat protein
MKSSIALAICLLMTDTLLSQDKVYPIQGAVASGKLVEITRDVITIEVRGNNQKLPVNEVRKIVFDDEPSGLDRAREMFSQEQYSQVLDELKKIDPSTVKNPLIVQDIEFYRFYSEGKLGLTGSGGDKLKAKDGLLALAGKNKNSHHMYDLSALLGDLAVGLGKPDEAARYYGVLMSSQSAETKALAVYRLAQLELGQGKKAEARTRFQQLAGLTIANAAVSRLKSLAEVGVAVCDASDGKPQQALEQLKQMVVKYDSTDQELFARIYNAQGACYIALEKPSLALLAYLRTDWMFFTDAESHAEALYQLSQLWPKVGEPSRATETRARLVSQYAGSVWANK